MTTPNPTTHTDVYLPDYQHPLEAQLLDSNQNPIGPAVPYDAGDRIGLRVTRVADEPTPPQPGEWPEHALTPEHFDAVDINGNLRQWLESHPEADDKILILNDTRELNELCDRGDPALLRGHIFTLKPGEFFEHDLTVNFGESTVSRGPTFQGFNFKPSSGGYHARHFGTGIYEYRLCRMRGGYKGVASTSKEGDTTLIVNFCDISGMTGEACAGIYQVRGRLHTTETTITEIGHKRGEPRPERGDAILNHAIYAQWDSYAYITNLFTDCIDSHAIQLRGGGSVDGLIANRTANGVLVGHDKLDREFVNGDIKRAIVVNTEDIDPDGHRTGVAINTERARVKLSRSILADEQSAGLGSAFKPKNDSTITLEDVQVQGINRLVDVDGHHVNISGEINWTQYQQSNSILFNTRKWEDNRGELHPYSLTGIQPTVEQRRASTLPDFDGMDTPQPGTIGTLIDAAIGGEG